LGVLTDVGSLTPHIEACLDACDALVLECNHDSAMLAAGNYPPSLKHRVGGRHGHLSNDQAAELLGRIDTSRLQHLVAAHLSDKNNTPDLARQAMARAMACDSDWIAVADQEQGLAWRDVV
jgi:phosphoribosyl 1,2-cyclic phosphodiesterase